MRSLPACILVALAAGCLPPPSADRPREMLPDDLEPAVSQLTAGRSGGDRDPDVSRDGRLLFYASTTHGDVSDLYVKSVGTNVTTRITTGPGDKRFPRVSPANPRTLAYCSNERGSWDLVLVPDYVDAPSKAVVLSEPGTDNLHPSWSPDGKKIVYCSTHERAGGEWILKIKDLATDGRFKTA